MKKLLAVLLAVCLVAGVWPLTAMAAVQEIAAVNGGEWVIYSGDFPENNSNYQGDSQAVIIKENGKYGVYFMDGTRLAEPTYNYAQGFSDNMSVVSMEGYLEGAEFGEEYARWTDGKYGYVDQNGLLTIPMQYEFACPFSEGRAFVRETADGPLLMIDKSGTVIAAYSNANVWRWETIRFSEGLAIIPMGNSESWGPEYFIAVDTSGNVVHTFQEQYVDFQNGFNNGLVATAKEGYWAAGGLFWERTVNEGTGWAYLDKNGNSAFSCANYGKLYPFSSGVAGCLDGGLFKMVDTKGNVLLSGVSGFWYAKNGMMYVKKEPAGNIALANTQGKVLTGYDFIEVWNFANGLGLTKKAGGTMCVLDTSGKTIQSVKGCTQGMLSGGMAYVLNPDGSESHIFDKNGKDVKPMEYDGSFGNDTYTWLRKDGVWHIYRVGDLGNTVGGFSDVYEDDYYADPVVWAVENGITDGLGNGKFGPGQSCTRGQIVTFLWRAAGEPEPASTENPFADVKEGDYFYKPVLWAAENGITGGTGTNADGQALFSPGSGCTRAQAVTFQWRAAGKPTPSTSSTFTDVPSGSYYADAVSWAVENKITDGVGGGKFAPNDKCTRGQIVTFLYRGRGVA